METVSLTEILKAGGPDKYDKTKGVDTTKNRISGLIPMTKAEAKRFLKDLQR